LNAPYADDPKNSGLARYQQAQLNTMTAERMAAGFQIGFHAIGDHAVEMALAAFADAEHLYSEAKLLRPRIEHSQVLDAPDFDRYKELGVIASMQPNHLLTDMNWAEARLGPERARYSYAWKSFLIHGVPLAFGTDYPVEPITPFRGLYAAVTRQSEVHPGAAYFPEEKLTIGQAISAYTQGAAYAEFSETYKGRLVAGFVADFVVLDRNLLAIAAPEILNTQVLRTVVGGKTIYMPPRQP
jgi:predicted amidohydrolase YtcJ